MAPIDHVAIAERAHRQLGLITGPQLAAIGVSRRQVYGMIAAGLLRRAGRGVVALAAAPATARQRLLAATLSVGQGAVASHGAAAWLWGFDGIEPDGMELSIPHARRATVTGGTLHRVRTLDPVDITALGPQPVTTPDRTLIDLASRMSRDVLEEALDGACRRGQVHVDFLRWRIEALKRPGRAGLSMLLGLVDAPPREIAESWLESAFLRLLRVHFLPVPRLQVTMQPGPGGKVRLDGFYDDEELVVEVSGHATHATRRHRQADAERRARLVGTGLRVVDFTYEDVVERPTYVADTVAGLLGGVVTGSSSPTR